MTAPQGRKTGTKSSTLRPVKSPASTMNGIVRAAVPITIALARKNVSTAVRRRLTCARSPIVFPPAVFTRAPSPRRQKTQPPVRLCAPLYGMTLATVEREDLQ
jgi:hypothetical protein